MPQDFAGQLLAERLYQVIIIAFTVRDRTGGARRRCANMPHVVRTAVDELFVPLRCAGRRLRRGLRAGGLQLHLQGAWRGWQHGWACTWATALRYSPSNRPPCLRHPPLLAAAAHPQVWAAGMVVAAAVTVPPWPCFRRRPVKWQPPLEEEDGEEDADDVGRTGGSGSGGARHAAGPRGAPPAGGNSGSAKKRR
jgi:hypothetical protein